MTKCKVTGRTLPETKHARDFIIGVSIGLAQDHTAIAILERFEELTGEAKDRRLLTAVRYEAPYLKRLPLGTGFTEITTRLRGLISDLPEHGRLRTLVDRTVCHRPPIDYMRKEGLEVIPVRIMLSGAVTGGHYYGFSVSKYELVSTLQLVFNADRIKIGEMPEAGELTQELQTFSYKAPSGTANDLEAWRERPSDDLVFSMLLPVWYGERRLSTILHLPPMPRAPVEARQPTLQELIDLQPDSDSEDILQL